MDSASLLERLRAQKFYDGQITHVEEIPSRPPRFAEIRISARIVGILRQAGIPRLYSHQARAIELVRAGRDVVVVTGTASGKTLCYTVPVMERLEQDPLSTMLFLYPTKALAQDQLKALNLFGGAEEPVEFSAGTYDGDTPQGLRRKLRDTANIVLTNPDMLHQGILPNHARWNRFFANLTYIVIDEIHAYRGIFGSQLANVMRRLHRITEHYGSSPVVVSCSATIANPAEHAGRIVSREMQVVDEDGSPRGARRFVYWNPPPIRSASAGGAAGGDRRSPLWEAVHLMSTLVTAGVQTIAFVRTRLMAELIYRNTREVLSATSRKLADSVRAYRGGYLPEERREIERQLAEREILGVASTNALELGIDIGSLDAGILVGYPGTIASLWQQAGRAGRRSDEALVFLVGQNSPIDQYLMSFPDYIFDRNPEQAVVDPDNPHIAVGHVQCAIHELPLGEEEREQFGEYTDVLLELLEEEQSVRRLDKRWYWSRSEYPAAGVSLRTMSGSVYTIQDAAGGERGGPVVIGTMDETSALMQLHDHAVYLHGGDTYFVDELDIDQKIARVQRQDLDYYTQSVQTSQITLEDTEEKRATARYETGFGEVVVTTSIPMFKKIRFNSRESLGFEALELPPQTLETVAVWIVPPPELSAALRRKKLVLAEGLIGVANLLLEVLPIYVMCDTQDIGAVVDARCLGRDAIFVYDRTPGGMGYARRCLDRVDEILHTARDIVSRCACEAGCPSCVGSAMPAFAMSEADAGVRERIPDKPAALAVLEGLLAERNNS